MVGDGSEARVVGIGNTTCTRRLLTYTTCHWLEALPRDAGHSWEAVWTDCPEVRATIERECWRATRFLDEIDEDVLFDVWTYAQTEGRWLPSDRSK